MELPHLDNLGAYPRWWAMRSPRAVAVLDDHGATTYQDLAEEVDRIAKALIASGVKKGDRVATLQTPHIEFLTTFLATVSIGAIWLGLNPKYQSGELDYVVSDAEPKVILACSRVGARDYAADLRRWSGGVASVKYVVSFGPSASSPAIPYRAFLESGSRVGDDALLAAKGQAGGRDPCLLVYTSGSTGKPKGALLHHAGVIQFARLQNALWPLEPNRTLNYFPINHIGSLVDVTAPTIVAGGAMRLMEAFSAARALDVMEQDGTTLWVSVPSTFAMQIGLPDFDQRDLSAVQLVAWEGAAMPEDLIRRLLGRFSRLATNYGMTETTSAITILEPTDDFDALAHSVGAPAPDVEVALVDHDGRVAGVDEEGEILVRSARNFLGYWNRPEATRDAFTEDGYFRTGDVGVWREDGRLKLVGRLKEMYKSGGYNVYPREVEAVLEAHPGIAQSAVVSAPDPVWGEVGVAFIRPESRLDIDTLNAWCRTRIAHYKIPKLFVLEPQLPLLPIGKVDKSALKKRAEREYHAP